MLCKIVILMVAAFMGLSAPVLAEEAAPASLLANGDFETSTQGNGTADGWGTPANVTFEAEGGNHFARLKVGEPDKMVMLYRSVNLKPEVKALELSYRVRYEDIKPGKQLWFDGRIMMNFKDADKKVLKPSPAPPVFRKSSNGWQDRKQQFLVPEGAVTLEIMPALFQAASGQLDFDDFRLVPIEPDQVKATSRPATRPVQRKPGAALIDNGDFETDKKADGVPDGWIKENTDNVSLQEEDGNHFLRLHSTEPGKTVLVYRRIPVSGEDKAFELTFRAKFDGIKVGTSPWFDGRIMMNFKGPDKKTLSSPSVGAFHGTHKEWKEYSKKFVVPEDAATLELMPSLLSVAAGTLDIDDLKLTPIDPETIPKPMIMTSAIVPAPPTEKLPPELHVDGNRLKTADGKEVWLQGLCVDSLEWSATGERVVQSIGVAIDDWKATCIRLPMKEEYWFGKTAYQKDGGEGYRQLIDSCINATTGRGAYLVLDLHRFRAPNQEHADFWKDAATRYKNHPGVIFELFNEPHDISWEVWRNGGEVSYKVKPKTDVAAENAETLKTFHSVGMQKLVDVIRETGAKNLIVAGGLDYSYDLRGILSGFALDDKTGNGIVYSNHNYPWKTGWQKAFIDVAEKYPLFIGEVGCIEKWSDFSFIPPSMQKEKLGPECTWAQDELGVIQKYKLNWTGFSFHPRCGPMVIKDWDYTPTDYWGVFVKQALAGKQFETQRLR